MSLFSTRFSRWLRLAFRRQAVLGLLILCCCVMTPAWGQQVSEQELLVRKALPIANRPVINDAPELNSEQVKALAQYIKQAEATGGQVRKAAGVTYIGIKPWIVFDSEWTASAVLGRIAYLNDDFRKAGIQFFVVSGGIGDIFPPTSFTAITYPNDEASLLSQYYDPTAINIYFTFGVVLCNENSTDCSIINGLCPGAANLFSGQADRPQPVPNPDVSKRADNYILVSALAPAVEVSRQMGFYFGLLLTSQGGAATNCQDRERTTGSPNTGDSDRGDLIDDTGADPYRLFTSTTRPFNTTTCTYTGTLLHCDASLPVRSYTPPVNNIMSYWDGAGCSKTFSPRQLSRIPLLIPARFSASNQYNLAGGQVGVTSTVSLSLVPDTQPHLAWDYVDGALLYLIERSPTPDFSTIDNFLVANVPVNGNILIDNKPLPPSGQVYYRVRVLSGTQYSNVIAYPCTAPTATVSGSQTITGGQSATYTVALTGTPPWRVQFSGLTYDNVTTSPLRIASPPFPVVQYTYTQTTSGGSVTNSCGTALMSGTVSVTVSGTCPTVSVTLTHSQIGCGQTTASGSIFTSPTGYTAQWRNLTTGTDYPSANTNAAGLTAGDYRIILTGPGGCLGPQQRFTIRDFGPNGSTATLVGRSNNRIIRGQQTSILVLLTGTAPWSVTYAGRGGRQLVARDITFSFPDIEVSPDSTTTYRLVAVSGQCSPTALSGTETVIVVPALTHLEYFVDADPGVGRATSVAVESNQTTTNQSVTVPIALTGGAGIRVLGVRAKDADGYWSPATLHTFVVLGTGSGSTTAITAAEYYVDTDPGVGQATPLAFNSTLGVPNSLSLNVASLTPGTHILAIRTKDGRNRWSMNTMRSFVVIPDTRTVGRVEYFFDNNDPGRGGGQPFTLDVPNSATVTGQALAGTSSLSVGTHTVSVRAQAGGQAWSVTKAASFTITPCVAASATLAGSFTTTTDQPLSFSVSIGGSPPFSLTANGQVQTNILTNTATITLPLTTPGTYTLTAQSLGLAVANGCGMGLTSGQIRVTVQQGSCTVMQTVKAGSWDDPTVWSCGRLPLLTDAVLIRHAVTMPASFVSRARKVSFDAGGRLSWGSNARLLLGL